MTAQPSYLPEIFEPSSFSYGWAAILWNADPLLTNSTYIGLTTYNNPYLDQDDDHLTVQYQMWYGDTGVVDGNTPEIYLSLRDGDAVSTYATNKGSAGNFSITGTLSESLTSPSD